MVIRVVVASDDFLAPGSAPPSSHELLWIPGGDAAALVAALHDADGLVVRRTKVTESLLDSAARLRLVQQIGIGTDGIDIAAARRRGVWVANTPGAVSIAVAEHAVLLLLAVWRDLVGQNARLRHGEWTNLEVWDSVEVAESTVGVIGYGSIGREIVRRLLAFDARVLVHTRSARSDLPPGVQMTGLEQLLMESDAVILSIPLTAETRGLLGKRELGMMKDTSVLVNVARGAVVDEPALIEGLKVGRPRLAALDVFAAEPLPADSPLRQMPNVLATPHCAGASRGSRSRIWRQVMENLDRLEENLPPVGLVSGAG